MNRKAPIFVPSDMHCAATGDPRAIKVLRAATSKDWAPVHESIAGPVIFAVRRISGIHQRNVETSWHLAFAPWSRDRIKLSAVQAISRLASASVTCTVTMRFGMVIHFGPVASYLLTKSGPADLTSASAART